MVLGRGGGGSGYHAGRKQTSRENEKLMEEKDSNQIEICNFLAKADYTFFFFFFLERPDQGSRGIQKCPPAVRWGR